ncbi:MAG: EF-P lysine aminoacylase EpmA [Ostreibacterium sp.]
MEPVNNFNTMHERIKMYQKIRQFFQHLQVREVETPILSPYASTDVHIDSFSTAWNDQTLYLHTSPEFYMKRLLSQGIGHCFQLAKVFRNEAHSKRHRAEFTLLEWYRLGFSLETLINEVAQLVKVLCPDWQSLPIEIISYSEVFSRLGLNPHQHSIAILQEKASELSGYMPNLANKRDEWLEFIFVTQIESQLGKDKLTFLTHYPASMAALSKKIVDKAGNNVAERFELYYQGLELANGFHELTDANEQQARFEADNATRRKLDKPILPIDTYFIDALRNGLPDCSGVALGIDRLLMLKLDINDIKKVMVD